MAEKAKILIVSNCLTMIMLLERWLSDNYKVVRKMEAGEELRAVTAENPDLIILDILMPNMKEGIRICLEIQQNFANIPIIMLSTWGAGAGKVRGLDLNMSDQLTEPFGMEELTGQIKEALQRKETNTVS